MRSLLGRKALLVKTGAYLCYHLDGILWKVFRALYGKSGGGVLQAETVLVCVAGVVPTWGGAGRDLLGNRRCLVLSELLHPPHTHYVKPPPPPSIELAFVMFVFEMGSCLWLAKGSLRETPACSPPCRNSPASASGVLGYRCVPPHPSLFFFSFLFLSLLSFSSLFPSLPFLSLLFLTSASAS